MNAGNLPLNVPTSAKSDQEGFISPSLYLVCVNCGNDTWMHHVFNQEGHRPYQVRRCIDCKGKKGRWVTQEEYDRISDERWDDEA